MNSCPHCSHNLLRHLKSQNLYWYCSHCRLETPDSLITTLTKPIFYPSIRSQVRA